MSTTLQPVSGHERVQFMDALRGFAVLGIFIANLAGFSFWSSEARAAGPWFSSFDKPMSFLHHWFIEGKFYTIFSLLFGWGIALQLDRLKNKGTGKIALIRRRLAIMLFLGLAHIILLWPGDIVMFYALLGFVLLWMRHWSAKKLLTVGVLLVLSPIAFYFLKMKLSWMNAPASAMMEASNYMGKKLIGQPVFFNEAFFNIIKGDNYLDLIKLNTVGLFQRYGYLFFVSRIPKVLGIFLIGYALGKNGAFSNVLRNKRLLRAILIAGFAVGLPANYMLAHYMQNEEAYFGLQWNGWYQTIWYAIGVAPLGFAYAATLALTFNARVGRKVLSVLQPVGKMAFSNYIFQSLVGVFTFYGIGFGMMGKVGPVWYTVFGVLIFTGQILISKLWLRTFQYGPLEWLWRSATYGKRQAVKRSAVLKPLVQEPIL